MPERPAVIEGRIFLKYDNTIEPTILTSVWVSLPQRGFMRKLNEMQKFGFWAPRPHRGEMIFVPPNSIIQAHMKAGDTE